MFLVVVSVVVLGFCEIFGDGVGFGCPFVIKAEVDAEANEGGEVEGEDHEAKEERRAASLTGELEILGVERHVEDSIQVL